MDLQKLNGAPLFSFVDMSSGFQAVKVDPRDQHYFATPSQGIYQLKRLPFGWSGSPGWYSKFVYRLISTLPARCALSYVGDILLYSRDTMGK